MHVMSSYGEFGKDGRAQALIPIEVEAVGGFPLGRFPSSSSGIRGRAAVGGRGPLMMTLRNGRI